MGVRPVQPHMCLEMLAPRYGLMLRGHHVEILNNFLTRDPADCVLILLSGLLQNPKKFNTCEFLRTVRAWHMMRFQ